MSPVAALLVACLVGRSTYNLPQRTCDKAQAAQAMLDKLLVAPSALLGVPVTRLDAALEPPGSRGTCGQTDAYAQALAPLRQRIGR